MERSTIFNGKIHSKWSFSIAMLVITRGYIYIYHYIFMANVACNHVSTNFNRLKKLGSTTLGEKTGEESMSSFNSTLYALMTGDPARDIIPAPNSQAEGAGGRRRAPEGAGGPEFQF